MHPTIDQVRTAIGATERAVAQLGPHVQQPQLVAIGGLPFYRHLEYDDRLASYLKCVQAVSSLNACLVLLDAGYTFEIQGLCRSIDECAQDVFFLAQPINADGTPSPAQQQMIDEFYKEEFTDPNDILGSSRARALVPRKKVHAQIARMGTGLNPSDMQILQDNIHRVFSGFVHGAYGHIMELFGGPKRGFHLHGMAGTPRIADALLTLASVAYRAMCAVETVAGRCRAHDIYAELRGLRQKFYAEGDLRCQRRSRKASEKDERARNRKIKKPRRGTGGAGCVITR